MTFKNDPAAPEMALNFDETLFSLPQSHRPNSTSAPTLTSDYAAEAKPELFPDEFSTQSFAPPATSSGIFSSNVRQSIEQSAIYTGTIVAAPVDKDSVRMQEIRALQEARMQHEARVLEAARALDEARTLETSAINAARLQAERAVQPERALPDNNQLSVLRDLQQVTAGGELMAGAGTSKDEIATILEGFARVLREGDIDVFADVQYKDRSAEISQLKELLLEAQETIIGLLNDRVFDRAKLAKMEAESRLMPDLQAQATRAMGLAMRSEEVQRELTHVRNEVERLRTSYVRQEQDSRGFFAWLLGKKATPQK